MAKLSCFKGIFIFFNLLFAVVGVLIIGLGLIGHLAYHEQISEFENQSAVFTIIYLVGGVTVMVSLLGAYGAHKDKKVPLIIFLTVCLVVFLGLLRLAVPSAIYRPEVNQALEARFRSMLPLNRASPDHQLLAENFQESFKCCGMFSYSDWGQKIPDSCLCQFQQDEIRGDCQSVQYDSLIFSAYGLQKRIYKQTCFPIIMYYLTKMMDISLGVLFGFSALALLGAVMSAVLLCQLRRSIVQVPMVFSVSSPDKFNIYSKPPKYSELYNEPDH
ncbi:hypothetical protein UPYG_G00249590 [Umbra pygmaea]|uniref:Tetraspanin n=1 Tax=Umbra pygmaea TaxID=75934 RepID=A0ABD0WR21_UMBPY